MTAGKIEVVVGGGRRTQRHLRLHAQAIEGELQAQGIMETLTDRYPELKTIFVEGGRVFGTRYDRETGTLHCSVNIGSVDVTKEAFRRQFAKQGVGRPSGHALTQGMRQWNNVPVVRPDDSGEYLAPRAAAEIVRQNSKAELIERATPELDRGYALMHREIDVPFHVNYGLPAPDLSETSGGLEETLSRPDYRMFFLRYLGPDIKVRKPSGIVEIKEGNLLGYHVQKDTRIFGDGFFKTVLQMKRDGETPEMIYAGIAGTAGRLDPARNLLERGNMPIMQAVEEGFFDRLNYSDMCGLDERAADLTGKPNAVFLRHINLLPQAEGLGLAEVFLRQAYAHDLDNEKANYAFAYARLGDLYKRYVPEADWRRFQQLWVLREETSASGRTLPLEDLQWVVQFVNTGGNRKIQEHVTERRDDGLSTFSTLRFHERAGGEIICGIPWCAMSDLSSLCAGVLVVVPLRELRDNGRI